MTEALTRGDPQNPDVEAAVLGSIMLDPRNALDVVSKVITEQDFYLDGHKIIFRAMTELARAGTPPDELAVMDYLVAHDKLNEAGGTAYVGALTNRVTTALNVGHHGRLILEKSRARELINIFDRSKLRLCEADNPDEVIFQAQQSIENVVSRGVRHDEVETMNAAALGEITRLIDLYNTGGVAAAQGLSTGIKFLDEAMRGFQSQDLITIGARPRTGKTHWGIYMLTAAMMDGAPVAAISIDMNRNRFLPYAIPTIATMMGEPVKKGELYKPYSWGEFEQARFMDVAEHVDPDKQFYLVADPQSKRVGSISGYISRLARMGVKVVLIDQLQNIKEFDDALRLNNRGALTALFGDIKDMGKFYGVCLVVLHQIGRSGADRPTLQDLRDTGAIEEKSDFVILLHDPQVALKDTHGGWLQGHKPWIYQAPGKSTEFNTNITNPRFISVDLAKTRGSEIMQMMVGFDYRHGVKVDYNTDRDEFEMPEGSRP